MLDCLYLLSNVVSTVSERTPTVGVKIHQSSVNEMLIPLDLVNLNKLDSIPG